jgi:hypothetical protein
MLQSTPGSKRLTIAASTTMNLTASSTRCVGTFALGPSDPWPQRPRGLV